MMKKFLFFMLAAALFCGCDKDDAPCPVTDVNIPASSAENPVQPGSPVTIQGKGFTAASEIWLRSTGRAAEVRVEITAVSATSLTFTAPDVSGRQNVVLKQDGGEWNLGKLYFPEAPDEGGEIAILPKKLIKVEMTYEDKEDGHTETYTTEYTYDESGRLLQIKRSDEYSQDVSEIEYAANEITMRDRSYGECTTFRLENGRAATCVEEESNDKRETEFFYGSNGYLSDFVSKATWQEGTDSYKGALTIGDGGYLKTYDVKEVKLEAGNYTTYTIDFTPNKNARNNLNLDLMGSDEFMELIDEQAIGYAYLLGIGGKRTTYLPEKFTIYGEDEEEGKFKFTVKYKYEFIGDYISKIIIDDSQNGNYITLKLYYEE